MTTDLVLVTGATGFIGSHLVPHLVNAGYCVHTISRRQCEQPIPGVCHHQVDITDISALRNVVTAFNWHAVVHLAGLVSYTSADAQALYDVNVAATEALVSLVAVHCPLTKFVYCSSVAAVGSNASACDKPLDEDTSWDPAADRVGYLRTKRLGEQVVVKAAASKSIRAAVISPSNVYGSRDAKKASRKTQVKAANGRWLIYTNGGVNVVHVEVVVDAVMKLVGSDDDSDELWSGQRWLIIGENITIKNMLGLCAEFGGNPQSKPWILVPNWILWFVCRIAQLFGSRSLTLDRFAVATRYHWFESRKAKDRFCLPEIPARVAIKESVCWMIENGMVQKE